MRLYLLNEEDKPYRNRVDVFAVKDDKVYGGFFNDGAFGVFGGGTDGEKLEDAASREFEEETGYKINNLRKLDIQPVTAEWEKPYKSEKQKERAKHYRGTRTWFYVGELDDSEKEEKAKGDDGKHPLSDIGLVSIDQAIKATEKAEPTEDGLVDQYAARVKALKRIKADYSNSEQ